MITTSSLHPMFASLLAPLVGAKKRTRPTVDHGSLAAQKGSVRIVRHPGGPTERTLFLNSTVRLEIERGDSITPGSVDACLDDELLDLDFSSSSWTPDENDCEEVIFYLSHRGYKVRVEARPEHRDGMVWRYELEITSVDKE